MLTDADPWQIAPRIYGRLCGVERQYVALFCRNLLGDRKNLQEAEVDDDATGLPAAVVVLLTVGPGSVSVVERVEYSVIAGALGQEIIWRMWAEAEEARKAYRWLTAVDPSAGRLGPDR